MRKKLVTGQITDQFHRSFSPILPRVSEDRVSVLTFSFSTNNKNMPLSHVVGIVSGGASGLGAATVACLVRRGARVIVADLDHQRDSYVRLAASVLADATRARAVTNASPVLAFAETDVTYEDQVKAALDMAETVFGEPGALLLLFV
jgi:NADP-dependent 3-hydroxy acid dehydrogenase YdfG